MSGDERFPWHVEQWRRLIAARQAQRLPHALLLCGPAGLGKTAFARRLGAALTCTQPDPEGDACMSCAACRQTRAGSHPDLRWVQPDEPGKMIKISAIRELSSQSVLAAQAGGYRLFIVEPADAMNRSAANALLKTLEEPVSRTVLFLVSSHPDRLPATIRSRCQAVRFTPPPGTLVRQWLIERRVSGDAEQLMAVSGGAPLRAMQAAEEGWIEEGRRLCGELEALARRSENPLRIVEEWQKRPLILLTEGMKRCVSDLVRLASGADRSSLYHPGLAGDLDKLIKNIKLRAIFNFYDEVLRFEQDTARNLNVQMMLEFVANRWLQMTRPGGQ